MKKFGWGVVLLAAAQALGQSVGGDTFYEFGTVVAIGRRDIDVQTFDPQRGKTIQRSFTLAKDTRADVVRVGDAVEVIYAPGGMNDTGQWMLRRLIMLTTGVPKPGPVTAIASGAPSRPAGQRNADGTPVMVVPDRKPVGLGSAPAASSAATPAGRTAGNNPTLGQNTKGKNAPGVAAVIGVPTSAASAGTVPGKAAVTLGGVAEAKVPGVKSVGLGASTEIVNGSAPRVREVHQMAPGEECHKDDAGWGDEPIKLAILDFRYPTEREEAHDAGTGGGSGTAVADLVYNALDGNPSFQLMRGDREKLFRMDFAGAARAGRQLGADAVLLGTFNPVQAAVTDPDFPPPVQGYTLRAGVVDTCSGQLLLRLTSIACPNATVIGAEGDPLTCPGSLIPTKLAFDPAGNAGSFRKPIEVMLATLQNKTPMDTGVAPLGSVVSFSHGTASLRVSESVHTGDVVAVHASRLAKNPTTFTLHRYMDEEIGRVIVERVSGGTASGPYGGDVTPVAGDAVVKAE